MSAVAPTYWRTEHIDLRVELSAERVVVTATSRVVRVGDHVEPRVFGLPWSLVWVLGVIVINTAVLGALYLARAVDSAGAGGGD